MPTLPPWLGQLTRNQAAELGIALVQEWLEAHPDRMGPLYTEPSRLLTWCLFAGGVFFGTLAAGRNPYQALDILTQEWAENHVL